MRDTNAIGTLTEARVMTALLSSGKRVLIPFGVYGYDLVFEDESGFHRVQCKTGRMIKGALVFSAFSRTGDLRDKKSRYEGRADFFGVFCPGNQQCYLFPVSEITVRDGWFRIEPSKNKQVKGIKYADPYLIQ